MVTSGCYPSTTQLTSDLEAESAVDIRDWDLFPDFGSAQSDVGLIEQTQLGKLSTVSLIWTLRPKADSSDVGDPSSLT